VTSPGFSRSTGSVAQQGEQEFGGDLGLAGQRPPGQDPGVDAGLFADRPHRRGDVLGAADEVGAGALARDVEGRFGGGPGGQARRHVGGELQCRTVGEFARAQCLDAGKDLRVVAGQLVQAGIAEALQIAVGGGQNRLGPGPGELPLEPVPRLLLGVADDDAGQHPELEGPGSDMNDR
jgi:hypothetical protein